MPNCAVATCRNDNGNTKGTNIKFYRFPKTEEMAKRWLFACRRDDKVNLKNATVCSVHFEPSCFEIPLLQKMLQYNPKNSRHLKTDAVPSVNLHGTEYYCKKLNSEERVMRLPKRRRQQKVNENSNEAMDLDTNKQETSQSESSYFNYILATEELPNAGADQQTEVELKEKIKMLKSQNKELLDIVKEEKERTRKYERALARVFTPGQIKKLITPIGSKANVQIQWSAEDIASTVCLHTVSPEAYINI